MAKAVPYNDQIKQRPFLKQKSQFMTDFTGDEEIKLEGELDEKIIQAQQELKEEMQMMSSVLYDLKNAWWVYDTRIHGYLQLVPLST